MARLTLSGRNNAQERTVYVGDEPIGIVRRSHITGRWMAKDYNGGNHGTEYTSDWNAAKQLALGLRKKVNPMPSLKRTESLTASRLTHLLKQLPAKAKLIIHKSGLVQAQVPKHASNPRRGRRKNIAAGFYDEEGIFHPIRASHDYSPSAVGERKKRKAKRRKSKR